jgi:hypothetical protein
VRRGCIRLLTVKAIEGLSLMPSDTGAMPPKIHPGTCIEGRQKTVENPGASRPSEALFYPRALEKSSFLVAAVPR